MDDGQQTPKPQQTFKQRQEHLANDRGKQPKTKRNSANGRMHPHEAASEDDDESAALPSAFNGQEIEDLDYGQGDIDEDELDLAVEGRDWWEDEEEDEEEEEVGRSSFVADFRTCSSPTSPTLRLLNWPRSRRLQSPVTTHSPTQTRTIRQTTWTLSASQCSIQTFLRLLTLQANP